MSQFFETLLLTRYLAEEAMPMNMVRLLSSTARISLESYRQRRCRERMRRVFAKSDALLVAPDLSS